jgi:hypothetical protein
MLNAINDIDVNTKVTIYDSFNDELLEEISSFLKQNSSSTIYHHPLWLGILAKETNQKFMYLIYRNENDKIEGALPLLFTRGVPLSSSPLSSKRISSLPRTPFAGIIAATEKAYKCILEEVKNISSLNPDMLVQIKSCDRIKDIDKDFFSTEWRSTYLKRIPSKNESFTFEGKREEKDILRAVKRAKENKVLFKKGKNPEELKKWYKLYLLVMRQNRIPPRSFNLFEMFWNILKPAGLLDINYAYVKEGNEYKLINGHINFKFNNKYYGGFKASDPKRTRYMGGDFLLYNELLYLQENNFVSYDLGEVSQGNKNLDKYKRKWGAEKIKIFHNYYGDIKNVSENLESETGGTLTAKIWRVMPLEVTKILGSLVNYYL